MPPKAASGAGGRVAKPGRTRVNDRVLTEFTSNLAVLQDAGLPIVRSLKILEGQTKVGPFKRTLLGVTEDVESGNSLSEAMGKHPGVFDSLYTNMVKAGEAGGILDTILARLAEFKEKSQRLRQKVQGAMFYPIVVTLVATALLGFIMVFVVPKFKQVYSTITTPDGRPLELAVRDAGIARFRPIVLTSLTTFAGLTPLLLETSISAQFLIPMATSLGFGVLFATVIALLVVPSLYLILEDFRGIFGFPDPRTKGHPQTEEVL